MQKNKKRAISITAVLKVLARRSFLVFLVSISLSAAIALLIAANYEFADYNNLGQGATKGAFGVEQAKQYQKVFSEMKQRQDDNAAAASSTYPRIFKELTE